MGTVSPRRASRDWQKAPSGLQKTPMLWEALMRDRGPAGRESGGVERHAPVQLGWALACREHQMRSGVRITAEEDPCKIALTSKGYLHRRQRGLQSRTFMVLKPRK